MNIFEKPYQGLSRDSFDQRDVWLDEIVAGDVSLPPRFRIEGMRYERQYSWPLCASFATTSAIEFHFKKRGQDKQFSQPHLFVHAGGGLTGSGFRANLEVARTSGLIPYERMPLDSNRPPNWLEKIRAEARAIPFDNAEKIEGYARVQPTIEHLKRALMTSGPAIIGVRADASYYKGGSKRSGPVDNHAVVLTGWDERNFTILDSLSWVQNTGGEGTIALDYGIQSAHVITKLPSDWKEVVEEVRSEPFANALNHYGKRRNLEAEQLAAATLLTELKKFNNQSVLDAAGRFWNVATNMIVYGGYSISYTKWGRWMPGDIINMLYAYRRTGKLIFDPNRERKEYP